VAFFADERHKGSCVIRSLGRYMNGEALGIGSDQISSIIVGSSAQAKLCNDPELGGGCKTYTTNMLSLGNLNGKASSARVEKRGVKDKPVEKDENSDGTTPGPSD